LQTFFPVNGRFEEIGWDETDGEADGQTFGFKIHKLGCFRIQLLPIKNSVA
jgi:hypothetical protein